MCALSGGRYEYSGRFQPGFSEETLRKGREAAVWQVDFDAFDPVHGKKDYRGSEGFTISNHLCEILEGRKFDAAYAESFGSQGENHSPEFFAWVRQRDNHHRPGRERFILPGVST